MYLVIVLLICVSKVYEKRKYYGDLMKIICFEWTFARQMFNNISHNVAHLSPKPSNKSATLCLWQCEDWADQQCLNDSHPHAKLFGAVPPRGSNSSPNHSQKHYIYYDSPFSTCKSLVNCKCLSLCSVSVDFLNPALEFTMTFDTLWTVLFQCAPSSEGNLDFLVFMKLWMNL